MKPSLPLSLVPSIASIALCLSTISSSRAQEAVPYLVGTGTQLELVGFPVHSPALDSGTVSSVGGTLIGWSPSFTDRPFGSALGTGQEYYAEVVGPPGHAWLGHRLELDEAATRARTDHGLVIAASPYNTRGTPNPTLAAARLEVRPHLTVDGLWGETVKKRLVFAQEPASSFLFFVPSLPFPRELSPYLERGFLTWHLARRPTFFFQNPLIIPPGNAVGIALGVIRGSALGITAMPRTWPTAAPLRAGMSLMAYPYLRDLRLGIDWGRPEDGFIGLPRANGNQDRIELVSGINRFIYTPESQVGGGIRWRQMQLNSGRLWSSPARYLDSIPVGQGFFLWKTKSDPNHFFYPPKP